MILFISCTNSSSKVENSSITTSVNMEEGNSCSYSGRLDIKSAYFFSSDSEDALKSIMKHTGLPTNFLLVAADVDNAAATIYKNQRHILYNQRFMNDVQTKTKSKYGPLSILSHEIGHIYLVILLLILKQDLL
jgi:hypothetical protein